MTGKKTIYQKYFEEQARYTERHGEKTIVFFQMGKFYDAYATSTQGYPRLEDLSVLLNTHYIRRPEDASNPKSLPNQFGINCVSIRKHLTTMVENGYTIVLFEQKLEDDLSIDRIWVGTYTAGTIISDRQSQDSNHMISVYLVEEKQLRGKPPLMAVGVTIIDITTGASMVHEFYSNHQDENYGLDELVRIIQTFRPSELIIYYQPIVCCPEKIKSIGAYLEITKYSSYRYHVFHTSDVPSENVDALELLTKKSFDIAYQNEYIASVFDLNRQTKLGGKQSPLEILMIEQKNYVIISFMIILRYISLHNPSLLKNLSYPEIYIYDQHLILGNNAIEQLNVVDNNSLEMYNRKHRSVFHVVNKTSTPMGRRLLMDNLLNPLSQQKRDVINERYQMIEELSTNGLYLEIRDELKKIQDMERLHRLMGMGTISPIQYYRLTSYYDSTKQIIQIITNNPKLKSLIGLSGSKTTMIKKFNSYQSLYQQEFNLDNLPTYGTDEEKPIFQKGIYEKIDKLIRSINSAKQLTITLQAEFTKMIGNESKGKKKAVEIENNERDGHYFTITKTSEKLIRDKLKKKPIRFTLDEKDYKFDMSDVEFRALPKGRTKIFISSISDHVNRLNTLKLKLDKLTRECFVHTILQYYNEYKQTMHQITQLISLVDFLVSGAIVAQDYYYCKPVMDQTAHPESYLIAEGLRHVIIERLCEETPYIPNDISLGNVPREQDKNGILLYGINSSGKTALIKSIGIAIILAQIGYYVPATSFHYEPYMSLYARITGNDNIFKGLSSFALEMTELNAILVRTENQGAQTLVIGDEVCRGTEDISGLALVSSALVSLSESRTSYIFATHLHELPNIQEVQALVNLKFYHLRVEYDDKNDCLVFDRKLTPGSGPRVYGLTVAKHMIKSAKFVNRAEVIRKRLLGETNTEIPIKKSKYNGKLIVKMCAICGYRPLKDHHKELETHHINFQRDCTTDGKILKEKHLTKNELYNLVVLCRTCHNSVHQKDIIIDGYHSTSEGPTLMFYDNLEKYLDEKTKIIEGMTKEKKKPCRQVECI
jgi:DNA mismatch repair protein MutS